MLLDEPLSNLDANLREEMRFEIRRLHDEYRYTTVYVTHDQAEAMTMADRIVVMNGGRIEQVGTPEDIYARRESEFVARFIGGTNVLNGTARDATISAFAGVTLRCGAQLAAEAAVRSGCTRPAFRRTAGRDRNCDQGRRRAPGLPRRQPRLSRGTRQGPAAARRHAELSLPSGSAVWLHLPPERCRALSR